MTYDEWLEFRAQSKEYEKRYKQEQAQLGIQREIDINISIIKTCLGVSVVQSSGYWCEFKYAGKEYTIYDQEHRWVGDGLCCHSLYAMLDAIKEGATK